MIFMELIIQKIKKMSKLNMLFFARSKEIHYIDIIFVFGQLIYENILLFDLSITYVKLTQRRKYNTSFNAENHIKQLKS